MSHSVDHASEAVPPGLADQRADDGERRVDDRFFEGFGDARNAPVLDAGDNPVFELVEPPAVLTRYDRLVQSGPRECRKSELDARIDQITRHVIELLHPALPDSDVRSIAEQTVMANWRRRA